MFGGVPGHPRELVGVDRLAVDDGADLVVAGAEVEPDTAAFEMPAEGNRRLMFGWDLGFIDDLHSERRVVDLGHEPVVEGSVTGWGVGDGQVLPDIPWARNEQAAGSPLPQEELGQSLRIEGAVGAGFLRRAFVNDCLVTDIEPSGRPRPSCSRASSSNARTPERYELLKSTAGRNRGSSGGTIRGPTSNCGSALIRSGFVSTGGRVAAATGPVGVEELARACRFARRYGPRSSRAAPE